MERAKAKADEDGSADGDRGTEARSAFKESSKSEGDEKKLQAAVACDVGEAFLKCDERACLDGEVVKEDDRQDDPADGEEAVSCAVSGSSEAQADGHMKGERSNGQSGEESRPRRHVRFNAQDGHGPQQHDDRQRRKQCGYPPVAEGVVGLGPGSGNGIGGNGIGVEKIDCGGDNHQD
jgi:hypothetical protein